MPSAVLTEADVAVDERGFHRRKFSCSQILFAKKSVHGPSTNRA